VNPLNAARAIVQSAEERREFERDPFAALADHIRREFGHIAGVEAYLQSAAFRERVIKAARESLRRRGIEPPSELAS